MNSRFFTLLILLHFGFGQVLSKNYYLSNEGSDTNDGLFSTTPWKSIDRINLELYGTSPYGPGFVVPGDSIFFRRGDVFEGQINVLAYTNNDIAFGPYGSGEMPILKGSKEINGWANYSGSVWQANVPQQVLFLYLNGKLQSLARYPNEGYLYTSGTTASSATSVSIGSSGTNFIGSNICMREHSRRVVSGQSSNSVSFSAMTASPGIGRNFYFDNKLEFIDLPGEWYYDNGSQTLFLQLEDGMAPEELKIEASINEYGFSGNNNRMGITIRNIHFKHFGTSAINLPGVSSNTKVVECEFRNNFQGVLAGGENLVIEDNSFFDTYFNGVVSGGFANGLINRNMFIRTGMEYGLNSPSFTGEFYTHAILLFDVIPGGLVSENIIDQTGYNGIKILGNGLKVERNVISNILLNMNDGAAIYTWGTQSYDCIIKNNIIRNVVGNLDGVYNNGVIWHGIYLDNFSHNISVLDNTISDINGEGNSVSGIIINAGSYSNIIRNNLTYNCGMLFSDYWSQSETIHSNRVARNVFYELGPAKFPLTNVSSLGRWDFGTLDSNYYYNACSPYVAIQNTFANQAYFTLDDWKAANLGMDLNSKASPFEFSKYEIVGSEGSEKIINGNFDANINDWVCWSSAGTCNSILDYNSTFASGTLQTALNLPSDNVGFTLTPSFSIVKDQWYVLRFKLKADKIINARLQLNRAHTDFAIFSYIDFIPTTTEIKEYEFIFKSDTTETSANISFRFETETIVYWLDEVSLKEVNVKETNPKLKAILFSNPSNNSVDLSLDGSFKNLDYQIISSITIPPWESTILQSFNSEKEGVLISTSLMPNSNLDLRESGQKGKISVALDGINADYSSFDLPNFSDVYNVSIKNWNNFVVYTQPSYTGQTIPIQQLSPGIHYVELSGRYSKWQKKIMVKYK
jgi:hypothetical protein